jgi:hypothetical protein
MQFSIKSCVLIAIVFALSLQHAAAVKADDFKVSL